MWLLALKKAYGHRAALVLYAFWAAPVFRNILCALKIHNGAWLGTCLFIRASSRSAVCSRFSRHELLGSDVRSPSRCSRFLRWFVASCDEPPVCRIIWSHNRCRACQTTGRETCLPRNKFSRVPEICRWLAEGLDHATLSPKHWKLFTKFFPGICLTLPVSSSSNSAAKISDDDIPVPNRSIMVSMCVDSSAFNRLRIRFS
jgi:hypothetical protein